MKIEFKHTVRLNNVVTIYTLTEEELRRNLLKQKENSVTFKISSLQSETVSKDVIKTIELTKLVDYIQKDFNNGVNPAQESLEITITE